MSDHRPAPDQGMSLRNERKPCHFWVDNEVADCYQPIVGADAIWVYCRIARNAHGAWIVSPRERDGDKRVSLREMAEWCGKSVDTVWRCLQVLQHVGLIRAERAAKSKGRYALADVKDLVTGESGYYDREIGSFRLPAARVAALKAEVKVLRTRLARKTSGLAIVGESVAQSDSLGCGLFSVPNQKCDSSVAPSDTSVAQSVIPLITTRLQDGKKESTPQPPPAGAVISAGGNGRAVSHAVDQVCSALAVSNGRRRRMLRSVIELDAEKGEEPPTIALAMIAAWGRQARNSPWLRVKLGMQKFFGDGYWKDENRWYWDEEKLRLRNEASVGTHFG